MWGNVLIGEYGILELDLDDYCINSSLCVAFQLVFAFEDSGLLPESLFF